MSIICEKLPHEAERDSPPHAYDDGEGGDDSAAGENGDDSAAGEDDADYADGADGLVPCLMFHVRARFPPYKSIF